MAPKCYIVPCIVCLQLYPAYRTDSKTCSGACRVRLKRHGPDRYRLFDRVAELFDTDPFLVRRARAVELLRPDLLDRIKAGALSLDECADAVAEALWQLALGDLTADLPPPDFSAPST